MKVQIYGFLALDENGIFIKKTHLFSNRKERKKHLECSRLYGAKIKRFEEKLKCKARIKILKN